MKILKLQYHLFHSLKLIWFMIGLSFSVISYAQLPVYPLLVPDYAFIQIDSNKIRNSENEENFSRFFARLDSSTNLGIGQTNIVYIGGSHVQADVLTGRLRQQFQNLNSGSNAGRGVVFPYRLAGTNNPIDYYFTYNGEWQSCRNVERDRFCALGMTGITAITYDSISTIGLFFRESNPIHYQLESLRIYHRIDSLSFSIQIDSQLVKTIERNADFGYTEYFFIQMLDSLEIRFVKTDTIQESFELYGLLPKTKEAGVILHNLGINGASTTSFLRCGLMEKQLTTLQPDMIIFGLGINDAYGRNFNSLLFEQNYDSLMDMARRINPNAVIVLLTNSDSYLYRRHLNRNGLIVRESMYKLAERHHVAVWDMFEVMGGLNSIQKWKKAGLAKNDLVHFTHEGYLLLGDLLFDALMKEWNHNINLKYYNSSN